MKLKRYESRLIDGRWHIFNLKTGMAKWTGAETERDARREADACNRRDGCATM